MNWIDKVQAKMLRVLHREGSPQQNATIEVLNDQVIGFSIAEIKNILKREFDIKCILHSKENFLEAGSDNAKLGKNDIVLLSAYDNDMDAIEALLGVYKERRANP